MTWWWGFGHCCGLCFSVLGWTARKPSSYQSPEQCGTLGQSGAQGNGEARGVCCLDGHVQRLSSHMFVQSFCWLQNNNVEPHEERFRRPHTENAETMGPKGAGA
jgi:hypothetical protein